MCEYCDGSKKPIETDEDGDGFFTLTPDDAEYPEGFLLDVYRKHWVIPTYSFIVPCCPMCGRELRGDGDGE
jgi:hypothetical protein